MVHLEFGAQSRIERSESWDGKLISLFQESITFDAALVAVGSYGRNQLAPHSDLDFVIVHSNDFDSDEVKKSSEDFLYPLWDLGKKFDYSIRSIDQTLSAAKLDFKVALGLLDSRFVIGNIELFRVMEGSTLEEWRKGLHLSTLLDSRLERIRRSGDVAFLVEPNVKESRGGLRDIAILKAIATSWITDIPKSNLIDAENLLLDVRDLLHQVAGRGEDRLLMQYQSEVASRLGLESDDDLLRATSTSARSIDYAFETAERRVKRANTSQRRIFRRAPKPTVLAEGVVVWQGEVGLAFDARIKSDPSLMLRAAAAAAQADLPLSPAACQRLAELAPRIELPLARSDRELFIQLLGAGSATVRVWEALAQAGLIEKLIPEWNRIRNLPQRNVLHRHTVDRHLIETVSVAATLTRSVHRPDLLLVAALLHDIAKGLPGDHSEVGAQIVGPIVLNLGWTSEDSKIVAELVKHHLLLPITATRRDLEDPSTITSMLEVLDTESALFLELLHALSIADGQATGKNAWTPWKAKLVSDLVNRIKSVISGVPIPPPPSVSERQLELAERGQLSVSVAPDDGFYLVEIISPDQVGLLAKIAGIFTIHKFDVRSARTKTVGSMAIMEWLIAPSVSGDIPEAKTLTKEIDRAFSGELDLLSAVKQRSAAYRLFDIPEPQVELVSESSVESTIIEVRSHDRIGLLFEVASAIAGVSVDIRAAVVSTLGAEAIDTLYLQNSDSKALSRDHAFEVVEHVATALRRMK